MNVVKILEIYNDEGPISYFINYDILTKEHKYIIDREIDIQTPVASMEQVFEIYKDGFNGDGWEYCILDDTKLNDVNVLYQLDIYEKE